MDNGAKRLRIAIAGLGNWGKQHLQAWSKISDVSLAAICSSVDSELESEGGRYGVPVEARFKNYDDMLQFSDFDALDVVVPNFLHFDVVMKAVRLGKHCIVEKPLAITVAQAQEMVREAKSSGTVLLTGMNRRYVPSFQRVRELVSAGELGRPFLIRGHYLHTYSYTSKWRKDASLVGGGSLLGVGIHTLDLMRWIGGEVRNLSSILYPPADGDAMEHTAVVNMTFENGAIGYLVVTQSESIEREEKIWVHCERGVVEADFDSLKIFRQGKLTDLYSMPCSTNDSLMAEFAHFLDCIRNRDMLPICDGQEGLKTLELIHRAYQS